jgi:hypothetical protein
MIFSAENNRTDEKDSSQRPEINFSKKPIDSAQPI